MYRCGGEGSVRVDLGEGFVRIDLVGRVCIARSGVGVAVRLYGQIQLSVSGEIGRVTSASKEIYRYS